MNERPINLAKLARHVGATQTPGAGWVVRTYTNWYPPGTHLNELHGNGYHDCELLKPDGKNSNYFPFKPIYSFQAHIVGFHNTTPKSMVRKGNGIYSPYLRLGLIKGPDDLSPIPCRLHLVVSGTPPTILVPETVVRCCRHGHFGERSRDSLCLLREGGGAAIHDFFFGRPEKNQRRISLLQLEKKSPIRRIRVPKSQKLLNTPWYHLHVVFAELGLTQQETKKFKTQK